MWALIKFALGPLGRILSGYGDYRNQKSIIEAGVLTSVIQADIETSRLKVQLAALDREWWVTRWIRPLLIYPVAFHWTAVIADSIFFFEWDVAALPAPMDKWEGQMILSFFVVSQTTDLIGKWMNRGIVSSAITNVKSIFNREK